MLNKSWIIFLLSMIVMIVCMGWHLKLNKEWNQIAHDFKLETGDDLSLIGERDSVGNLVSMNSSDRIKQIASALETIDMVWMSLAFANFIAILVYLFRFHSRHLDWWRRYKGIEPKVLRRKDGTIGNFPRKGV